MTEKFKTNSDPSRIAVRVEKISKKFGRFLALDEASFEIEKGEILGFLGPNGAGKTTTMRILTGFFPPSGGKVWIGGQELIKRPEEVKKKIGYLPETVHLYSDMRVEEFLRFAARLKGVSKKKEKNEVDDKIARCNLGEVRRKLIGHLSKGFRQRAGLAQALLGDPELLILDEPTSGLDPKQIIEMRGLIREIGRERTLVLSTHILPEVSMVCSRVLIMNRGRIMASGTTEELEAGLKKLYEVYVMIQGAALKDKAFRLLESIEGVERVSVIHEKNDEVGFSLSVQGNRDLRPGISKIFVENQIPLLEIRSGRLSLEEIFMKIVVNEQPVNA